MKRKNATRSALFTSIISLLLCVSMLVGTTFAWFTDEVTSGRNQIASGNLDVVLEYKTNWSDDWTIVDQNTKIFKDGALYEPGYTEVVFLRVSNAGSLALKYNLTVGVYEEKPSTNVADEEFKLSDYLQVGTYIQDEYSSGFNYADILMPAMFGSRETALSNVTLGKLADFEGSLANGSPLLPGDETAQVVAMVLTMPETVGNEANHKTGVAAPEVTLGINLVAAQYTHEYDSFDNMYDANAEYTQPAEDEALTISTIAELREAAATGGTYKLVNDLAMDASEPVIVVSSEFVFDLNGFDLDFSANTARPFEMADGSSITVNAAAEEVKVGVFGFINIPADNDAEVILNGGNYSANTDSGAFIKPRGTGVISIAMTNVNYTDVSATGYAFDTNSYTGENLTVVVDGGNYSAGNVGFAVKGGSNSTTIKNAKITAGKQYGVYVYSGDGVSIENCEITGSSGVGVANGATLYVTDSTVTGTGTYALRIMSSGGTIDVTNTTYNKTAYISGNTHGSDAVIIKDGVEIYRKAAS